MAAHEARPDLLAGGLIEKLQLIRDREMAMPTGWPVELTCAKTGKESSEKGSREALQNGSRCFYCVPSHFYHHILISFLILPNAIDMNNSYFDQNTLIDALLFRLLPRRYFLPLPTGILYPLPSMTCGPFFPFLAYFATL
jgi:hypothetical protein